MKIRHPNLGEILLPDFLIVGAAKSATSSLYFYLDQHPEIHMAKIKESWFFSFVDKPPSYDSPAVLSNVVSRLEDYVKLFEGAHPGQLLGDASPSYLYTYRDTIGHLQATYPPEQLQRLKIVISLRDPVSRAYSQYLTFKRKEREPLSFEEAVDAHTISERRRSNWNIFYDYIGFGRYADQVAAYLETFGKDRLLILFYEDIERDPVAACASIQRFLGVDASFVPDVRARYNALSGEPSVKWIMGALTSRHRVKRMVAAVIPKIVRQLIVYLIARLVLRRKAISEQTRSRLVGLYTEDIRRLEQITGRDLSTWRAGA